MRRQRGRRGGGVPCYLKRRYANQREALAALELLMDNVDLKRNPTRVYRCPVCRGWHLTSQAKRKED